MRPLPAASWPRAGQLFRLTSWLWAFFQLVVRLALGKDAGRQLVCQLLKAGGVALGQLGI